MIVIIVVSKQKRARRVRIRCRGENDVHFYIVKVVFGDVLSVMCQMLCQWDSFNANAGNMCTRYLFFGASN